MLRRLPKPETKLPPLSGSVRALPNSLKQSTADTNSGRMESGRKLSPGSLDHLGNTPPRQPIKVKLSERNSSERSGTGEETASLRRSRCSACCHKDANAIAIEIISGASYSSIAERYDVSKSVVARHAAHLPENLIQARLSAKIADQDVLLAEIVRLKSKLTTMFDEAEKTKSRGGATQISGALLRTFELLRKVVVDQAGHNPQPNRDGSEDTAALIGKVFQALKEHPDARIKLAEAILPSAKRAA
jgi:hypothetical protein